LEGRAFVTPFDAAVAIVLLHEGGYSNDVSEPGKETNLGITAATLEIAKQRGIVPHETVLRALTADTAKDIYRELYWRAVHADVLPSGLALALFDTAVNMGVGAAVSLLQGAVKVQVDAVMGPDTIRAAQLAGEDGLDNFFAARVARYCDLAARKPALLRFRNGWLRRCFAIARAAASTGAVRA